MSWFQLDAESTLERVRASGRPAKVPSLGRSLVQGMAGFMVLSVAGFAPWAAGGRWLHRHVGEMGLYLVCAAVFIGLSGPLLHGLIIGPKTLGRFYKIFGIAFSVYAVLWIAGWMVLRGHPGSVVGLLAGTTAMGWILARGFGSREMVKIVAVLFILNSLGYFIGGVVEGGVMGMKSLSLLGSPVPRRTQGLIAMLLWGVFYGFGFGAGLGWAFYLCQARARELLGKVQEEAR